MMEIIKATIQEIRPRQWIKNLSLFTAIIFSGELVNAEKLEKVTYAFLIFCALSAFTYIANDIHDVEADRRHPNKRKRPIAAGRISIPFALTIALILLTASLISAFFLSEYFFALSITYIGLTLTYSYFLKNIAIIESMTVAMGFLFRVMAGSLVISVPISSWLMICTIALALLISFGRRKAEITLLGFKNAAKHRPVLEKYPKKFLEVMISSLVATTFLSYTMFTFSFEIESGLSLAMENILPDTLKTPKWLMLTVPITFYAIARYLYLIYNKREKGQPEKLITSDMPFLFTMLLWGIVTLVIIYFPANII